MSPARLHSSLAAFITLSLAACSDTGAEVSSESGLIGGSAESGYSSVGYFMLADGLAENDRRPYVACTGTLLAPDIVLTAAHCFHERAPDELVFGVGDLAAKQTSRIRSAYRHPYYHLTTTELANDVAVVHLQKPMQGVTIATLGKPAIGGGYRNIGYGQTVPGAPNPKDPALGTRKSAELSVTKIEADIATAKGPSSGNCFGDSGGPLMRSGTNVLVGILSGVEHEDCKSGAESYFADVSYFAGFIDDAVHCKDRDAASFPWECATKIKTDPGMTFADMLWTYPYPEGVWGAQNLKALADSSIVLDQLGATHTFTFLSPTGKLVAHHTIPVKTDLYEMVGVSPDGLVVYKAMVAVTPWESHTVLVAVRRDGQEVWRRNVGPKELPPSYFFMSPSGDLYRRELPADTNNRVDAGRLVRLDPKTGSDLGSAEIDPWQGGPRTDQLSTRDGEVIFGRDGLAYASTRLLSEINPMDGRGTRRLVAIDAKGVQRGVRKTTTDPMTNPPIVTSNGTLIVLTSMGELIATAPNGSQLFKVQATPPKKEGYPLNAPKEYVNPRLNLSPKEDRIVLTGGPVSAYGMDGKLLWKSEVLAQSSDPAFLPDGRVFFLGQDDALHAFSKSGTETFVDRAASGFDKLIVTPNGTLISSRNRINALAALDF